MGIKLQIVFIIASILTFIFVIRTIQKHGLNIDDSIGWICWSIVLLVLSVFPQISFWISNQLGFMSTSNFILCIFIFFLYIMVFSQQVKISKLKEKQKQIIQKLSVQEYINKRDHTK